MQKMLNLNTKSAALVSIAEGQVDAGQMVEAGKTLEQALRNARQIRDDPYNKTYALVSIAEGQVGAGQIAEAGKTWEEALRAAESMGPRAQHLLIYVVEGQAKDEGVCRG